MKKAITQLLQSFSFNATSLHFLVQSYQQWLVQSASLPFYCDEYPYSRDALISILHTLAHLLGLALADERAGIGRVLVLQALSGALAACGIEKGLQLVKRCLRRGFFLCKAVRVEADEHGPVDSFLIQFFHVSSSVSFLQIATYMKKVRTDTRCGLSSYFRPYFLLKRSTRPPVSTSFCLPV